MNQIALIKSSGAYLGRTIFFETPKVDDCIEIRDSVYRVVGRTWRATMRNPAELRLILLELLPKEEKNE